MSWLVALMVVGLGAVALLTARQLRRDHTDALQAGADLKRAMETGALPPSLYPRINLDRCIGSGSCTAVCPEVDVLALVEGKAAVVNPTSCIGHGECLRACPVDAIDLVIGTQQRGVDIPHLNPDFQTNVPGLYIVGELGGMGLIYNAVTQALQCMDGIRRRLPRPVEGVHQLAIVGAGPAGLAASLSALEHRLDFVTIEQSGDIGGTVLKFPRAKLVMTRPVDMPLYGRLSFTEVSKEDLVDVWRKIVDDTGLLEHVALSAEVQGLSRGDDGVFTLSIADGRTFRAQRVILALGRRGVPNRLGPSRIPGSDDRERVRYELIDPDAFAGEHVLVIGGGDAAVEAAMSLARAGAAAVTLSYRRANFPRIKKKNQKRLDEAVADPAVPLSLLMGSNAAAVRPGEVELTVKDADNVVLRNDRIFAFIGGKLPRKLLEGAGISIEIYKGEVFAPANR